MAARSLTWSARSEERKVVSVLFCDLVGFRAAAEAADPEDVRARLRPYQNRVRAEVEPYGATVEKFIGDAVMLSSARGRAFFAEAAQRWREFGVVPEQAYALLGLGAACCARTRRAPARRSRKPRSSLPPRLPARRRRDPRPAPRRESELAAGVAAGHRRTR